MGFYDERVLPYLVHLAMRQETFLAYRQRVVQDAHGRVLEIGVGSGLNLPLYGEKVRQVTGLESLATASVDGATGPGRISNAIRADRSVGGSDPARE